LDDLDGLAGMTGPPTARRDPAASHHYPSLERSAARKKQRPVQPSMGDSSAVSVAKPESRSMEDLEVLENAGARGSARPRPNGPTTTSHHLDQLSMTSQQLDQLAVDQLAASQQLDQLAASQQALDDLVYRTQQTTLRNTDEYPTVNRHGPPGGYDDVVDKHTYPLPLPARRTTLLPGQTYPEPAAAATPLPAMHHSHTVAALREVFSPHRASSRQTHLVHARKVETTFGLNDSVHTHSVIDAATNHMAASSPHIVSPPSLVATTSNVVPLTSHMATPPSHMSTPLSHMSTPSSNDSDEPKPPLFPKQYWQRQHGSPWADTSLDSPAVPRKLKPPVPLPSSVDTPTQDTSVDTVVSPADHPTGHQGSFIPYRETTKPFEMSDYYKYSSKFRKASASSLKSTESDSPDSPRSGSGTASQRSSTSRESVPPDLPARPVLAVPAVVRLQPNPGQGSKESLHKDSLVHHPHGSKESLADAFSTEMLAWYEQKQNNKPATSQNQNQQNSGKPATLV